MATFNKVNTFSQDLCHGVHNFQSTGHVINLWLSNQLPNATDTAYDGATGTTGPAEISTGNGYTGPQDIQNDTSLAGATTSITAVDVTITATGSVGPFQYVAFYNDTATSPADAMIGWYDYGSAVTLANGEEFVVNFGASWIDVV